MRQAYSNKDMIEDGDKLLMPGRDFILFNFSPNFVFIAVVWRT